MLHVPFRLGASVTTLRRDLIAFDSSDVHTLRLTVIKWIRLLLIGSAKLVSLVIVCTLMFLYKVELHYSRPQFHSHRTQNGCLASRFCISGRDSRLTGFS
ncbi:hypothetical protein BC938DRAFT_482670 [Jimgerdemannia flammicorona]|uniref:Uncharacterized protein n=1 Tax=Jimgerdemannia flammicorona TaxID=994334 RepID=A0A433QDG5_9FUNG|nr:hypothetical protein BC938DRAFT_482670 [Jimgerdemannia flammicorona]